MGDPGHSRLAPSAAGVWVKCPASVIMQEQGLPNEQSEHAREGEASHWVGAEVLNNVKDKILDGEGSTAPNGVILTEEMVENALIYSNEVTRVLQDIPHCTLHIEEKVEAPYVHPESWGSVDAEAFDSRGNGTIYLWDYKYGYGIIEVFENWQMINYALGLLYKYTSEGGSVDPKTRVIMAIVQPRPFHEDGPIRVWETTAGELSEYAKTLSDAAGEALGPDPRVISGSHCRYCRARHACPAAHKAAMTAIDITGQAAIESLNPEALSYELSILRRAQEAIEYRLTGVEAQALAYIKQKGIVPGWGVKPGMSRVTWDGPAEDVFILGDINGIELRKPPEPITPKQAEKAGLPVELVNGNSSSSAAKLKLVPDDGSKAQKVFGGK